MDDRPTDAPTTPSVTIDTSMVLAFVRLREGETLKQFQKPADASGIPVPVYCCLNCSTLYADADGEKVIRDDGREHLAECPCKHVELVDARSLKFDYAAPACATCGAIFEAPNKETLIVEGVPLPSPCAHAELISINARERGIAYWEDKGAIRKDAPPVARHIVRAVRLGKEAA